MLHAIFSIGWTAQQGYSAFSPPLPATGKVYSGYAVQLMFYSNHITSKAEVLKVLHFILHSRVSE